MVRPRRAVIVGGGMGGLALAARLRANGWAVAVYEAGPRTGGRANRIERDGYRFDTGPTLLNYPWVFEQLFAVAGRRLADYVELAEVDPSIRFIWPDGAELTLSSRIGLLLREFERFEPGVGPRVMAFMTDAERKYRLAFDRLATRNADGILSWLRGLTPADLLRSAVWRSLDGELRRCFRSPRLRQALGSYAMYLGGSPWDLPGLFSILPYGELAHGLWLPRGGMYALVEGVERLARELGAEIHTNARVARIRVAGGRAEGVELAGGRFEPADAVVSNVDVPTTWRELLDRDRRPPRMTPGVVTFYWGLRDSIGGLDHHTIFLPDNVRATYGDLLRRGRIPDQLAFYVCVASARDRSLAPPGGSTVFALVPVPRLSELGPIDWPHATADLRRRVRERLRRHGADFDAGRIEVEEVWTPEVWRARYGLWDGSAFGAAHGLFELGPFRSPNRDPDVRGLYYVGASTVPGTGVPLVTLGAAMTAERMLADAH